MMRHLLCGLLLVALPTAAFSQSRSPFRRSNTFGELYHDKALQKELRLTRTQIQRMKEIRYQKMRFVNAMLDSEVSKALGITRAQRTRFRKVKLGSLTKMRALLTASRKRTLDGVRKRRAEFAKIRNAENGEFRAILTKSQLARFKRMCGKPFSPKPRTRPDV